LLFQFSIQAYDAHMNWRCELTETHMRINNVEFILLDRDTMGIGLQFLDLRSGEKRGYVTFKSLSHVIP
jgi:hypothetical protein